METLAQLTQSQAGELIKSLSAQNNGRHVADRRHQAIDGCYVRRGRLV